MNARLTQVVVLFGVYFKESRYLLREQFELYMSSDESKKLNVDM